MMKPKKTILLLIIAITSMQILMSIASALTISSVSSSPQEVLPGERAKITLTIENNLGENTENAVVNLNLASLPFAPYQSSNERGLGCNRKGF